MYAAAQAIKTTISPEGLRAFVLAIENPDGKSTPEGRRAYYRIVYDERKEPTMRDCFFAFGKEQFEAAIRNHHMEDALKAGRIKSGGAGLYGTAEGLRQLHEDLLREEVRQREALTASGVTPQDCYLAEYDNYECMYGWDGDLNALRSTAYWFGADALKRIQRKGYACTPIEDIINNKSL